ncbi:response regulator [Roseobacter sp. HKCCA0434]|uniref:response regulator n=1 Tax=Roseobacter sp. HKCCA0434 TaxID=3079297 RepID=UPI002905943E|nr:response regulator [Roseobacter sp. HKCCA0434]
MSMHDRIGDILPELRRFARALCGSQHAGDAYAAATLEAILADPTLVDDGASDPKRALFEVFGGIWRSTGARVDFDPDDIDPREAVMQGRLSPLSSRAREALLLRLLEDFGLGDIARIMRISTDEAQELVEIGMGEVESDTRSRVLIIEDEPLIAMDLSNIVEGLGHDVIAVARTHTEAVAAVEGLSPDLILADVRLADGSSGIEAVDEILEVSGDDLPVIFITAFPQRLLTGERKEPAFIITKPFEERKLRVLIDQALFFRMLPDHA